MTWAPVSSQKSVFLLDGTDASMDLAGALGVAVGLKGGRNQATVTGPEGCLQFVVFTSVLPMVCVCPIQLDKTQQPRQSSGSPL